MRWAIALVLAVAAPAAARADTEQFGSYACEVAVVEDYAEDKSRNCDGAGVRLDCETWTESVTVRDYACSNGSETKRFSCTQTYVSGFFPTISTTCNCGFWGASSPDSCF